MPFLDGLRALASLYVLVFHELTVKVVGHGQPSLTRLFIPKMDRGRFGVVFFIVLSGYSLMLPVARAGSWELVGGFRRYLYRRSRRILPPYYAALALSIAAILANNAVAARHGLVPSVDAALTPGSILSHLLLLHNLTFDWVYRINGPMWSVATEWQIYFVFAAALLPLWRWAGGGVTVVTAWIVGSAPFFLLPADSNFFWACPWFIGSFAMGMAGAAVAFSPKYRDWALRNRIPWGAAALLLFGLVVALCASGRVDSMPYPLTDFVVSALALSCINACLGGSAKPGGGNPVARLLGSRTLVYLGGFSYSLYLVQHPILRLTEKTLNALPLSYDANVIVHLALVTPAVIGLAWVFSELFERPFTGGTVLLPLLQRQLRVGHTGTT